MKFLSYLRHVEAVKLVVWVDVVVVKVDAGCGQCVGQHQQQDQDMEDGGFENPLEYWRCEASRLVGIYGNEFPAIPLNL